MPPGERQPEAGALAAAGEAGVHLAKRLEGNLDLCRGHAQSGVAHLEFEAAIGTAADGEDDGAAGIGELDRVRRAGSAGPAVSLRRSSAVELAAPRSST